MTSLSSRQARAALLDVGSIPETETAAGRRASPSRDAALTLGGVREAAAQPIAALAREQHWAGPEEGDAR